MRYIGLSLSFCVRDLLEGKIDERDVLVILTGTELKTQKDWNDMVDLYHSSHWREFSYDKIINILDVLKSRIIQPALNGQDRINLSKHLGNPWISDEI